MEKAKEEDDFKAIVELKANYSNIPPPVNA